MSQNQIPCKSCDYVCGSPAHWARHHRDKHAGIPWLGTVNFLNHKPPANCVHCQLPFTARGMSRHQQNCVGLQATPPIGQGLMTPPHDQGLHHLDSSSGTSTPSTCGIEDLFALDLRSQTPSPMQEGCIIKPCPGKPSSCFTSPAIFRCGSGG